MAGTSGGLVFCVCWHGRGIKNREVNGMKRRILTVCLLLALLLTACGGEQAAADTAEEAVKDHYYQILDAAGKELYTVTDSGAVAEIDALIKERDRAVGEMRRLNDSIEDEEISAQIDHLEEVTRKIIDLVVKQPKKLPQIRRFLDYYLPTTLKILNAYDRMDAAGISGENIDATKKKVEQMMATISQAFDRQLDALFGDEALDISTDITVMEQMLQREGLGGQKKDGDGGVTLEL